MANRTCERCEESLTGSLRVNPFCSPCILEVGEKVCSECLEKKNLEDFSRDKTKLGGRRPQCKLCRAVKVKAQREKNPEPYRESSRRYFAKNPEVSRALRLKAQYGLTIDDFERMVREQEGKCGLCSRTLELGTRKVHIDHDHLTGRVRGILCFHCNTGLGNLQDDPDLLLRAALYVMAAREEIAPHASV